ncbi:hypothetical protein QUF99_19325 [Bacillus sp. DX4.1]|uniref:hypothetical protein n=1 Tax=Bacillus sp. DX4.1 TaxID=3055867 RepID=UPI0025A08D08|nr:hypothetical protein [Bacillus sp. DX4.1]MDM5189379.1 hypothetical protein [Bacillus sp. DX4.1]
MNNVLAKKACLVTGKLSEDNVELLDGRIALSKEGAKELMDLLLQKGEAKGRIQEKERMQCN